jgi:uncharacterized protein YkwD
MGFSKILVTFFLISSPLAAQNLYTLTNDLRDFVNKAPLAIDQDLEAKACAWSKAMHNGACGWFRKICHRHSPENVAYTSNTRLSEVGAHKAIFTMWKGSKGHYRNMIGNYSAAGMCIYKGPKGYFGTQIFRK